MPRARRLLTRIHVWLGWVIGVPLLFWTVSGLWMVARPIEEVRGTALKAPAPAIAIPAEMKLPVLGRRAVSTVMLEQQVGGPRWIVGYEDGGFARADAATGRGLPSVGEAEARSIARAAYLGKVRVERATYFERDAPPTDLRRPRPSWQVRFADGANLYVDAQTGQVLALRTRQWRIFDWMWGLHIMDLQDREDSSHFLLIGFAALAAVGVLLALILLPIASRGRR